jgi:hypothetical protein
VSTVAAHHFTQASGFRSCFLPHRRVRRAHGIRKKSHAHRTWLENFSLYPLMLPLRCDDTLLKMQLAWVMPRNAAGVLLASFGKPVFSYAPILPPCTWVFKPIQFRKYFPSVFTMSRRTVATTLRVFLPRRSCDASTAAAAAGGARWDNCSHFRGSVRRYVYTQHGVLKCVRSFFHAQSHMHARRQKELYIYDCICSFCTYELYMLCSFIYLHQRVCSSTLNQHE